MLRHNNAALTPGLEAKLASPQAFLLEAFEKVGLTLEVVGETLLEVMTNTESPQRIEAAKLFLESTFGRAPNAGMQKHLHVHAKSDKFFDADEFSKAPTPKLIGDK